MLQMLPDLAVHGSLIARKLYIFKLTIFILKFNFQLVLKNFLLIESVDFFEFLQPEREILFQKIFLNNYFHFNSVLC